MKQAPGAGPTVLILTAAVAGGHEAAGRAIQADLEQRGYRVVTRDGLALMSRHFDRCVQRAHAFQVLKAPRLWQLVCFVFAVRPVAVAAQRCLGALFGKPLERTIQSVAPDLVISTNLLVSAALGHLAARRRLNIPVVAAEADYGAHPMCIAPGIDLTLLPSAASVAAVRRVGRPAQAVQLPVPPNYASAPPSRAVARQHLGLPQDAFVILIAGGTMGVGDMEGAAVCALEAGASTIVVTGRNEALRSRLTARLGRSPQARILGWADNMPELMTAADCLIQNAGGMTCIEAIALGLPIIMYRPIPGHGQLNARVMEQAGAAITVNHPEAMIALLKDVIAARRQLQRPGRDPSLTPFHEAVAALLDRPERRVPAEQLDQSRTENTGDGVVLVGATGPTLAQPTAVSREQLPLPGGQG